MGWLGQTFASSIGKKFIMAATGALLGLFAVIHAAGNATSLLGREAFLAYARGLHRLDFPLLIFEPLLLAAFLLHAATGVLLTVENFLARPCRYAVKKSSGGATLGSRTMIYTGIAVLFFIPVHLLNFRFRGEPATVASLMREVLQVPALALLYLAAGLGLALHVSHGFWSLLQTLGFDHPKYLPLTKGCALALTLLIGGIFTLVPVAALWQAGFLQ